MATFGRRTFSVCARSFGYNKPCWSQTILTPTKFPMKTASTELIAPYTSFPKHPRLRSTVTTLPDLTDESSARDFILSLDHQERQLIRQQIQKVDEGLLSHDEALLAGTPVPSGSQLWQVFVYNGLPFIGFGLLDNVIMIIAGEYIDSTIGAMLGISTMAAAALGNLISDVAGVGTAGYVEALVSRAGVQTPDITTAQGNMWQTRWMVALGRAIGVSLGCLLGMFPLLFYDHDKEEKEEMEALKILEVKGATTIEKASQQGKLTSSQS